MQTVSFRWNY